jgi:hypothetical protein
MIAGSFSGARQRGLHGLFDPDPDLFPAIAVRDANRAVAVCERLVAQVQSTALLDAPAAAECS